MCCSYLYICCSFGYLKSHKNSFSGFLRNWHHTSDYILISLFIFADERGCSYCGGLGHRITECPKLEAMQNKAASSIGRRDYLAHGAADWWREDIQTVIQQNLFVGSCESQCKDDVPFQKTEYLLSMRTKELQIGNKRLLLILCHQHLFVCCI